MRFSARSTAQRVFLMDVGLQQNEVAFLHRVACVFQISCAHGHTNVCGDKPCSRHTAKASSKWMNSLMFCPGAVHVFVRTAHAARATVS